MQIFLLRHADADTVAATDDARRLSDKGIDQARKVARFCKSHRFELPLILTSPVRRAQETATIVSEHLGSELLVQPWLACGMHPQTALDELAAFRSQESVMIVGHEPDFSQLCAHLLGLPSSVLVHIRKASLTHLDVATLRPGTARLEFSIPCRLM